MYSLFFMLEFNNKIKNINKNTEYNRNTKK